MKNDTIRRLFMGILSGNPKEEPMHYGEVFTVWTHLLAAKSMVAGYQTLHNHAGDDDLKKLILDIIENGIRPEIKELETILKDNGVALPPAPPERPDACVDHIPPGARVTDPEIAATLAADNAAGLVGCSAAMGKCIREDIAAMFGQFHMQKAQFGLRILRMNKEKGWLIPPPLHLNTADHC